MPRPLCHRSLDFDATLGFPGEGPAWIFPFGLCFSWFGFVLPVSFWLCLLTWISFCFACSVPGRCRVPRSVCLWWGAAVLLGDAPTAAAMPIFPTTAGDLTRARMRSLRPALTLGRPVETKTLKLRERLLEQFGLWLGEQGLDMDSIFSQGIAAADDLNILLCRYGRLLYQSGKTYNSFAETINAY